MSRMSVSSAFNRAACGSLSERAAAAYDHQMNQFYSQFDMSNSWINETITRVRAEHDMFMESRMWEFGKITNGNLGNFVSRFEIGYLGPLYAQSRASGFMVDIIAANPNMHEYYEAGIVEGFEQELDRLNTGLGEDNYYYRKVNDGTITLKDKNKITSVKTHWSTRDRYTFYSVNERHDSLRTWRATDVYLNHQLDPTSPNGGKLKIKEEE